MCFFGLVCLGFGFLFWVANWFAFGCGVTGFACTSMQFLWVVVVVYVDLLVVGLSFYLRDVEVVLLIAS